MTSFAHELLQRLTKEKSQALTETYKKEYRDFKKKKHKDEAISCRKYATSA